MWILNIRSPIGEPTQHVLQPGNNTIGRMSGNDIVILDTSASRYHAKIVLDEDGKTIIVHDLGSTNGSFVNRERLTTPRTFHAGDVIRIGQHLIELTYWENQDNSQRNVQSFDTKHLNS